MKQGEVEHWQLSELESLDAFPLDYRVTKTLKDTCPAVKEVHSYLNKMYCGTVSAEFDHLTCENERLWCYENYERIMNEPISKDEQIKAL
jgi:2-oxoglutarate dehydrogenase complex dehydrogenase (E1) component-like enzyme